MLLNFLQGYARVGNGLRPRPALEMNIGVNDHARGQTRVHALVVINYRIHIKHPQNTIREQALYLNAVWLDGGCIEVLRQRRSWLLIAGSNWMRVSKNSYSTPRVGS